MYIKRFYDEQLAQASYLVGCVAAGEAIVIDPNRDIDAYLAAAEGENLRITAVTETHIHADFISGTRELAQRTGATAYLSAEGGPDWQYAYVGEGPHSLLHDGDTIRIGNLVLQAIHTPGHTPEHMSFLLTDTPATSQPVGIFTGDFVFVGDVGRPDLLERAAGYVGTMEAGARRLYQSLQRFKQYPDYLQIWPGHGAGSACGKGLSAVPQSTIGYERLSNWAFAIDNEDQFVREVLAGQPEAPVYFAHMKRLNKVGPRLLSDLPRPRRLPAADVRRLLADAATVVDTRQASSFASGHIPGTINIPLDRSFTTWAGWLLAYDKPFYLVIDDRCGSCLEAALRELGRIGLDQVAGYLGTEAVEAWAATGQALATIPQVSAGELAVALAKGDATAIDVRGQVEWEAGHVPGIVNIPLGYLASRLAELPAGRPLVVHCQSGARSAIAASLLQAKGIGPVANLVGGYQAWCAAGLPTAAAEVARAA